MTLKPTQHGIDEAILQKIDKALDTDDSTQQGTLFDTIIEQLRNLDDDSVQDEAAYLIGYLSYLHPRKNKTPAIHNSVSKYLVQALHTTNNPSVFARSALYLGHHAYDNGDYHSAAEWLDKSASECLPDYLLLKAMELRLCCTIRIEELAASLPSVNNFVSHAESMPIEDIWPEELALTLEEEKTENLSPNELCSLQKLAKRLDTAGNFGNWFSDIVKP